MIIFPLLQGFGMPQGMWFLQNHESKQYGFPTNQNETPCWDVVLPAQWISEPENVHQIVKRGRTKCSNLIIKSCGKMGLSKLGAFSKMPHKIGNHLCTSVHPIQCSLNFWHTWPWPSWWIPGLVVAHWLPLQPQCTEGFSMGEKMRSSSA